MRMKNSLIDNTKNALEKAKKQGQPQANILIYSIVIPRNLTISRIRRILKP